MSSMVSRLPFKRLIFLLFVLAAFTLVEAHGHHHHGHSHDHGHKPVAEMPNDSFHKMLFSKDGNKGVASKLSSFVPMILSYLFPGDSAMVNSFLATFYISFFPNILLLFVPSNIKSSNLNILVSFAVGGLLGDVFLHLLPHTFSDVFHATEKLGHEQQVLGNVAIGLSLFAGASGFYILDKLMRIISGNRGHSHSHDHSHESLNDQEEKSTNSIQASSENKNNIRKRNVQNKDKSNNDEIKVAKEAKKEIKLSAYLNLIADFSHNFTDGLAIAASFYVSKSIGISTTIAVFFHEIPHEIGDFAILLQSGFSRLSAMYSQFFTAIGALLGTVAGVAIQEMLHKEVDQESTHLASKLFGIFPITVSDLVLPITAGGFLYIATVSVIPELLETPSDLVSKKENGNKLSLLFQLSLELSAMFLGVALMALVSIYE